MPCFYDLWDDPTARLPSHANDGEWAAIEAEHRAEWRVLTLRAACEIRLATEFSAAREAGAIDDANAIGRRLFDYRAATRNAVSAAARRARARALARYDV